MPASDPTPGVPTPTGTLQGVAAFAWDGTSWQPTAGAGPDVATPTGVLRGVAPFSWDGAAWQPAGRAQPGIAAPGGVLDGVAVYTWSGSAWTPAGGQPTPSTPSGALRGVAAFNWDGAAWQPAGRAGPSVATPYGVLDGVAMFNWTGTAWTPAPSLALNFMTPGTLDQRITFTRASTATYFDVTGTLQTAAVNAPRWDYDPVTHVLRGLLIEEARTNLWLQSADASNAAWLKASGVVASPVVTANQTTAPDGTLTAARVVFPAVVGGGAFSVIAQGITATAAVYTFSVWLKGSVGGEQLYINANNGNPYSDSPRLTLTTQWQRITLVTASLAAASYFFNIGTDLRDVGQATTSASTIFVWGAQVELGAFPTSYIPTAGATVTRAIDLCSIPPANMGFYTPPGGSWMAEFISNISAPTNTRIIGTNASGPTQLFEGSGPVVAQFDGAAIVGTVNSLTVGAVSKAASNWAAGTGKTCLNGGTVTPGAMATGYAATATSGVAFLNSVGGGSATDAMTGYLRRVRYWPRVLSDAEMQAVTT